MIGFYRYYAFVCFAIGILKIFFHSCLEEKNFRHNKCYHRKKGMKKYLKVVVTSPTIHDNNK